MRQVEGDAEDPSHFMFYMKFQEQIRHAERRIEREGSTFILEGLSAREFNSVKSPVFIQVVCFNVIPVVFSRVVNPVFSRVDFFIPVVSSNVIPVVSRVVIPVFSRVIIPVFSRTAILVVN